MHARIWCLQPPWYSTCAVATPPNKTCTSSDNTAILPICMADKPKRCKQTQNVFADDREFPDETEHYKHLLRNFIVQTQASTTLSWWDGSTTLVRVWYSQTWQANEVWSRFVTSRTQSARSNICANQKVLVCIWQQRCICPSEKLWMCYRHWWCLTYCNIKKILYGPKESPIMWNAITALVKVGQIHQITDSRWLFKALLVP